MHINLTGGSLQTLPRVKTTGINYLLCTGIHTEEDTGATGANCYRVGTVRPAQPR